MEGSKAISPARFEGILFLVWKPDEKPISGVFAGSECGGGSPCRAATVVIQLLSHET